MLAIGLQITAVASMERNGIEVRRSRFVSCRLTSSIEVPCKKAIKDCAASSPVAPMILDSAALHRGCLQQINQNCCLFRADLSTQQISQLPIYRFIYSLSLEYTEKITDMYKYKINEVRFTDGTVVHPGALTIIVGPNNSGKSRALRDIETLTTGGKRPHVVVSSVEFPMPQGIEEFFEAYEIEPHIDDNNNVFLRGLSSNLTSEHNIHVGHSWKQDLEHLLSEVNKYSISTFAEWFGHTFVSMFSTEDRLKIIKETESAERGITQNILQAFYKEGPAIEEKVRDIIKEAFQKDLRLDYSSLRKILLRIGDNLSSAPLDPREALPYYSTIEKLDDQGDGIRSFVATVLTILVGNRPVLLLDEPEAFLHPPQAFRLGEVIAQHSRADRQVFVATHSSEFLRGVLSQRHDVTLVRVDRVGASNAIKVLNSDGVARFANDPLLSSTRILDGLFYKGAIIVEADADAVFYQRLGRQLVEADNYHIAHAHNKQTVAKVLEPYQSLGIQYAAIVDFDVIRVQKEFVALIKEFQFTEAQRDKLLLLQSQIVSYIENVSAVNLLKSVISELERELETIKCHDSDPDSALSLLLGNLKRVRESGSSWKRYKKEGRFALDQANQAAFDELYLICAERGLFIVPVGELEGWLVNHGVDYTSNKSNWIVTALEKIPELTPNAQAEPWRFLQSVFSYLKK
jgi:hypothetical protein